MRVGRLVVCVDTRHAHVALAVRMNKKRPEPCARKAAADRIAVLWDAGRSIGDMWTNAQPASRNERITWITSPSCRTAIGRPQRRKTFSMERLRESTSASSRSRPFTRAMAII
jgi:hypothetical protein